MAKVNPYLNFKGNTEEAFNFYRSVFGGDFSMIMRFKDVPPEIPGMHADPQKILHMALPISRETTLMGSDFPDNMEMINGNNFSVSLQTDSEEEARRLFDKLSEGGQVGMPLGKAFWGDYFGMCHDKFGVNWSIDYSASRVEADLEKAELEKSAV